MERKTFKQQWEEVDFALGFKIALRDFWKELTCSLRGEPMPPRTTQEEYLELLHAKRNTQK